MSHIVVFCLIMFISYNTIKHVFKTDKVNKGMWRENYFCCAGASTTEYNKVAWGGQTSTTSYNIAENKRNVVSYNICLVKSLTAIKLHTTRYNKVAKRVQHFIKHESCMMLYEMLYSFGRGLSDKVAFRLNPRSEFFWFGNRFQK